jgi:hypothetical protein
MRDNENIKLQYYNEVYARHKNVEIFPYRWYD